jgi:TonB family protein
VGTVQLGATIDPGGRVSAAKVLRAGTMDEWFRQKAIEELQMWEFQPALRNGAPIEVDIVVEIPFQFRYGSH